MFIMILIDDALVMRQTRQLAGVSKHGDGEDCKAMLLWVPLKFSASRAEQNQESYERI